ncbi:MAG: type IX secretion system membrane protein PorP/SprF [Cyclobacteriaceae bacterium]|nr:type IX secretion system membrane protein PorP/SprF [Cyclobacteriaceae bacterium HetDA_MAG_MS6]
MKRILIKIAFLGLLLAGLSAKAQQEFMITQYMYNGLAMNPAYAGIHEGISLSFLTRHQWVGIEGAPTTQLVSIHSPLNYRPVSLGAVLYRDQLGVKKEHTGYFSYAYRIRIKDDIKLSFGLQANFHQINQNFILGAADDPNDPLLQSDNSMKFNAGSGLLLHSNRFYVGFSVPQMLKTKFGSQELNSSSRLVRHYYLTAGVVFGISETLMLKPNILVKAVENAPIQADLNLNALISNILWVGVSHRWKESFDGLVALQISPKLQLGYAFDFTNSDLNSTSHEVMLNYIINLPSTKILTPRYF